MPYDVMMGTLNPTHSHSPHFLVEWGPTVYTRTPTFDEAFMQLTETFNKNQLVCGHTCNWKQCCFPAVWGLKAWLYNTVTQPRLNAVPVTYTRISWTVSSRHQKSGKRIC